MLRDPVSNPIRWLMLVSAVCLIIFLYSFTNKTLAYIDSVGWQSQQAELEDAQIIKHRRESNVLQKNNLNTDVQGIDEP